jgi:hypothetical protein
MISLFLALHLATADAAPAGARAPHYLTARQLLDRCTKGAGGADYCFGYVTSVYDTVRAYEAWLRTNEMCVPRGTSQGELVNKVVDHLRAHPRDLDSQAASVVVVALQRGYRCSAARRR